MRILALVVAVAGISIVQLYVAAPLGLYWDLNLHAVALATFIGGMIGVMAFVFFGTALIEKITAFFRWLFRRPAKEPDEESEDKPPGWFARLVERFGAPFLGIVGPITIGGWAAALLGRANSIAKLPLILWLAAGQAIVTAAYVYSLAAIT